MYTYCIISTQIKVQKCLPTVSHQKCRQIYIIISTQMKTCLKPDRIFAVAYRHVVWCVCWARIVQSVLRLQQKVHNITTVELFHFLAYNNKLHGIYNVHCYFDFRTRASYLITDSQRNGYIFSSKQITLRFQAQAFYYEKFL